MAGTNQVELKKNIETVILASFKRSKEKKFTDLNFLFVGDKTISQFLKGKLKIFQKLDIYSQTFTTIYAHAKITYREFNEQKFEGGYLELLRQILTLPEELNSDKLKSVKVEIKNERELTKVVIGSNNVGKTKQSKEIEKEFVLRKNTKLIKPEITGKKITKQKNKEQEEFDLINLIDFDEEVKSEDIELNEEEFDELNKIEFE